MSNLDQTLTRRPFRAAKQGEPVQLVIRLWEMLTTPNEQIIDKNERRQARLLSALLGAFLLLMVMGLPFNAPVGPAIFLMLICYLISRTRYFVLAGILSMAVLAFPSFVRVASFNGTEVPGTTFETYMWLVAPLILAKLILPLRGLVVVTVLYIAGIFAAYQILPDQPAFEYTVTLSLMFVIGIVLHISSLIEERYLVRRQLEDLREAQHEINRTNRELEAANHEIRDFAYIVAHDLRVPLVNMQGFMEELHYILDTIKPGLEKAIPQVEENQREEVEEMVHELLPEYLKYVDTAVERMDYLTGTILKLSRAGRRELNPKDINMGQFVKDIVNTYHYSIEEQNIRVEIEPLPDLYADPLVLQQVFSNLIDNAIKYLDPSRPGHIKISCDINEQTVIFHVQDNGTGIKPVNHEKVFQIFRRAIDQEDKVNGEGLGLPYIRTLIQRMHGEIWFRSEYGKGSTFSVLIPTS